MSGTVANYITGHPWLAPIAGAAIGSVLNGVIAIIVALKITPTITKSLKSVDATFEFSKKYHELLLDKDKIDEDFSENPTKFDEKKAHRWWIRFFDLMLFELQFFEQGLVSEDRFAEWMHWRALEYNESTEHRMVAGNVSYRTAWEMWRRLPANVTNPLAYFLQEIHGDDIADDGERIKFSRIKSIVMKRKGRDSYNVMFLAAALGFYFIITLPLMILIML